MNSILMNIYRIHSAILSKPNVPSSYLCLYLNPYGPPYYDFLSYRDYENDLPPGFYGSSFQRLPDERIYWFDLGYQPAELVSEILFEMELESENDCTREI